MLASQRRPTTPNQITVSSVGSPKEKNRRFQQAEHEAEKNFSHLEERKSDDDDNEEDEEEEEEEIVITPEEIEEEVQKQL